LLYLYKFRERDKDKDGKLSFQEYYGGLFYLIRNYDEFTVDPNEDNYGDATAKKLFSQIDKDNDGYGLLLYSFPLLL
jgi:calumenin